MTAPDRRAFTIIGDRFDSEIPDQPIGEGVVLGTGDGPVMVEWYRVGWRVEFDSWREFEQFCKRMNCTIEWPENVEHDCKEVPK